MQAPIYHRPTSWFSQGLLRHRRPGSDDGVRSYSDEAVKPGRLLELDVFLPDGQTVTALVEVAWCDPLSADTPARFDVGLRFVQVDDTGRARLESVLAPR